MGELCTESVLREGFVSNVMSQIGTTSVQIDELASDELMNDLQLCHDAARANSASISSLILKAVTAAKQGKITVSDSAKALFSSAKEKSKEMVTHINALIRPFVIVPKLSAHLRR